MVVSADSRAVIGVTSLPTSASEHDAFLRPGMNFVICVGVLLFLLLVFVALMAVHMGLADDRVKTAVQKELPDPDPSSLVSSAELGADTFSLSSNFESAEVDAGESEE